MDVMVCFATAVTNTMTQAPAKQGLTCFTYLIMVHLEGKLGQELKQELKQSHEGILLSGSLTGWCSTSFLIQPKTAYLEMVTPPVVWGFLYRPIIKHPTDMSTGPSKQGNSQIIPGCVKLTAEAIRRCQTQPGKIKASS